MFCAWTVWWINIFERDGSPLGHPLVRQTPKPIRNNTDFTINSYDTHAFIVKFLHEIPGTGQTYHPLLPAIIGKCLLT